MRRLTIGAAAIALAGCGTATVNPAHAEGTVRRLLARHHELQGLRSVRCPAGVPLHAGETFRCLAVAKDGSTGFYTLHETGSSGGLTIAAFTPSPG